MMTEQISVVRQTTFNTEPTDIHSPDKIIRRGNIQLPVVDDTKHLQAHQSTTDDNVQTISGQRRDDSEVEIFSDVGLVDDADTDLPVPLHNVLSVSSRKKLKKEPRIKVPSSKFDTSEPSIQEEKTQEILALRASQQENSDTLTGKRLLQPNNSQTIVVGNQSYELSNTLNEKETILRKANFPDSNNNKWKHSNKTGENKQKSVNKQISKSKNPKQQNYLNKTEDLDSSLCESDLQPKDIDQVTKSVNSKISDKETYLPTDIESDKLLTKKSELNFEKSKQINRYKKKEIVRENFTSKNVSSEYIVKGNTLNSEGNSGESVSGDPKTQQHKTEKRDNIKINSKHNKIPTFEKKQKMESDGYDYASETFEEVLQERNAMVKAERTYLRRIKQLEEELKGVLSQSKGLSDENKELRKLLDLKSDNEKGSLTADSLSEIARQEKENRDLLQTNQSMSSKIKELELKTKNQDSIFVENTRLKNKNTQLEKKIQELQIQILNEDENSNNNETYIESIMEDNRKEKEALNARVSMIEEENKNLAESLEEKRKETEELLKAMSTETKTEKELHLSKIELENSLKEINAVKKEVDILKQNLKESEKEKEKIANTLTLRENEVRKSKAESENKDRIVSDLRNNLDKSRHEIKKIQEEAEEFKNVDKEINTLKSRIGSLRAEIESSISENLKLKQDREESQKLIDKFRNEITATSEAVAESKRYFKKWESEKDAKSKCEVELAKKDEDINILDSRLRDASNKINALHGRVRMMEDEQTKMSSPSYADLETNFKIVREENKKLRAMVVEKNIELTNKSTEQKYIDNRIQILEKRQKDSAIQVKQLEGWVTKREDLQKGNPHSLSNQPHNTDSRESATRPTIVNSHPNLKKEANQSPMESQWDGKPASKKRMRTKPQTSVTPPPAWQQKKNQSNRHSPPLSHTPLSLPILLDTKPRTPPEPHGGYFQMYQEKVKRMKERKF